MRTGVQFSFDIGTPSVNQDDDIRVVYATELYSPGAMHLATSVCTRDLVCAPAPEWTTVPYPGVQYNPVVAAQPGFLGVPHVWQVSYNSTEFDPYASPGTTVAFMHARLSVDAGGNRIVWVGNPLVTNQALCPDDRGYWGDYDDLQILSVDAAGNSTFIRTHTDSSDFCTSRDEYTSWPVHVSAHTFQ